MDTKYLIIGNSIAGLSCVEAIREVDRKGEIAVISDEDVYNYSRPLISYYLGGRISEESLFFKEKSFYEENRINLLLGRPAQRLENKEVLLKGGKSLKYKKLLIATGGVSIVPPIKGLNGKVKGIFTFTKLADAKNLISYIKKNRIKEAVVLGAGLIGLKTTEGLLERGLKVKIIELADRVLANTFDKEASVIIERRLKKSGCDLIKENTIKSIGKKKNRLEKIVLKNGEEIFTKLLILAIGVKPNLKLLQGNDIKTSQGVLVDRFMETNVRDVYAAGDVAQGPDFLSLKNSVIPIWPVAARQGKVAGFNMAGKKEEYNPLFIMNSVQIFDIPTISFGETNPEDLQKYEILKRKDLKNNFYKKIVIKGKKVVGVILVNRIERAGIYGALIRERIDVSSFKEELLKEDFGFLVLPREFRKHFVTGEGIEV